MTASPSIPAPPPPRLAPVTSLQSPFDNPAVLWLLIATGLYVLYPVQALHDVVASLRVGDTDDAMRLVAVRDLLAGQSWFDMVQHRLMPPAGIGMHWSRYVDAPLAALVALATPLFGRALAEGLVAALWPPALFAAYLVLVHRAVKVRFGPRAALLALFCATQTGALGPLFAFGRIDHHNVQILTLTGLGLCLAPGDGSWRRAAAAGGLAAFSLAVGLEAVPFLALAGLLLLADWVRAGPSALPALVGFSTALALASLVLFAGQTAPSLWSATACDALSPPWLWIAAAAGAGASGAALLSPRLPGRLHRAGFAAAAGLATLVGFVALFPACLTGPFHDMPAVVRSGWLDHVNEMRPFRLQWAASPGDALAHLAPLLVGGLAAAVTAFSGPEPIRRAALIAASWLLTGVVLAQGQFRGIYMACAVLPFVAGPLFDRAIGLLRRPEAGRRAAFAVVLALLTLARVWAVPFAAAERLAAAAPPQPPAADFEACTTRAALHPLTALEPGTILSAIDLGPFLLLQTGHAVVAAPYHRAIDGLGASVTGLSGDEAALRRALQTSGATYLVQCAPAAGPAPEGATPFALALARGTVSAPWLQPLAPTGTPIMAWRVAIPAAPSR